MKNQRLKPILFIAAAITVGATTSNDAIATYSNCGSIVDILAPGTSITSDWITSNSSTRILSGTSMTTPPCNGCRSAIFIKKYECHSL